MSYRHEYVLDDGRLATYELIQDYHEEMYDSSYTVINFQEVGLVKVDGESTDDEDIINQIEKHEGL